MEQMQEDVTPKEVQEDVTPKPVQEDVTPKPVQEDVTPKPVQEDVTPVQADVTLEQFQKDVTPEPVQEASNQKEKFKLNNQDLLRLRDLKNKSRFEMYEHVNGLLQECHELNILESREITRGKYLGIFKSIKKSIKNKAINNGQTN